MQLQEPQIIRATKADVPQLNKISLAAKKYWHYPDSWIARWRSDLQIKAAYLDKHHVFKMVLAQQTIAFMAVEEKNNLLEIAHLWVLPAYIGKGFGKRLLNSVLALVARPGARLLVTEDPHAEGFYQRQGFTTIGRQESYPPGRFLPVMQKIYQPTIIHKPFYL